MDSNLLLSLSLHLPQVLLRVVEPYALPYEISPQAVLADLPLRVHELEVHLPVLIEAFLLFFILGAFRQKDRAGLRVRGETIRDKQFEAVSFVRNQELLLEKFERQPVSDRALQLFQPISPHSGEKVEHDAAEHIVGLVESAEEFLVVAVLHHQHYVDRFSQDLAVKVRGKRQARRFFEELHRVLVDSRRRNHFIAEHLYLELSELVMLPLFDLAVLKPRVEHFVGVSEVTEDARQLFGVHIQLHVLLAEAVMDREHQKSSDLLKAPYLVLVGLS